MCIVCRNIDRCLRGILKDKLVILVTHQVHFALQTDKLLALKDVSLWKFSSKGFTFLNPPKCVDKTLKFNGKEKYLSSYSVIIIQL